MFPGETVPIIKTGRCKLDITCATHTMTYFYFYLGRNGSEIPRPDDMMIEDGSNYVGVSYRNLITDCESNSILGGTRC